MAWIENGKIVESLDQENFESWIDAKLTETQWERISNELVNEISCETEKLLKSFADDYFEGVFDESNEGATE